MDKGSHFAGHGQQVVERVCRLSDLVSQGEGDGTVKEATQVGGVHTVVAHGVRVAGPQLLLHALQLMVAHI
eukprot:CAMPEP_0198299216 /NCGR_PEP_ID=MMETSP1449-20131203/43903_1 /TAXON_ID=420275 /ORGANISM="Attheya septentrionalis, Strain CCMP2084" /LENGTH=70 /DNA_ID=CAMNT_0044000703 /DNA_START=45 /DNA_END=254 /DNA_ORIENTATION=-